MRGEMQKPLYHLLSSESRDSEDKKSNQNGQSSENKVQQELSKLGQSLHTWHLHPDGGCPVSAWGVTELPPSAKELN